MTPKQYAELLEYIKENNCWGVGMYDVAYIRRRKTIKYVRASFDSRDGRVWQITLDHGGGLVKDFRVEDDETIKEIYEYLDETDQTMK